jgi:hypothetical protein
MGTFTEGREMRLKKTAPGIYQVSDQESAKECAKLETGMFVEVKKAKKDRSKPEHDMVFAKARKVLMHMPEYEGVEKITGKQAEKFLKFCMIKLGYCDVIEFRGEIQKIPYSVKFQNMKQDTFHRMHRDLDDLWSAMLGCTADELNNSIGDIE